MSNILKRAVSPVRECNDVHKRRVDFSTPPRPPRSTLDSIANETTPSCSTPANLSDTCTQNTRFETPNPPSKSDDARDNLIPNTPVQFVNNSSLREDELLLYFMMTLVFPVSTFTKNYVPSKYDKMIDIIYQIIGVKYSNQSIRNYFHRVSANKLKGVGKTKGTCRWIFYKNNVKSFLEANKHLLTPALHGEHLDEITINSLVEQLKSHCTQQSTAHNLVHESECYLNKKFELSYVNQVFELNIMPKLTSTWSKHFNNEKNTLHFYQFGKCPGYAEKEIEITAAGTWSIYLEGKLRSIELSWADIPNRVQTCNDLTHLLDTIGSMKLCQGCQFDKYKLVYETLESESEPLFKTKDGTPAAFVEIWMSKNKEKVIRSSKCILFLWQDGSIKTPDNCQACESVDHYLRTKLSRMKNKNPHADQKSVRYDYMSKDELLEVARKSLKEMKHWKQKCQRLDNYRNTMTTVGKNTNSDLQHIFKKMYDGVVFV